MTFDKRTMPLIIGINGNRVDAGIVAAKVRNIIAGVDHIPVIEPEYDHVLDFGVRIMDVVWQMSPTLRKYSYTDDVLKRFNIDLTTHQLTKENATCTFLDPFEKCREGIMTVRDYVKYFGRVVIPQAFGQGYWIKSLINDEEPGWLIATKAKYEEEENYINERGFIIYDYCDCLNYKAELAAHIILSKMLCPLSGKELLEFIKPTTELKDAIRERY